MERRLILSSPLLEISINRLCQQIIENHQDFSGTVIIGIQPRGVIFASRIHAELEKLTHSKINFGQIDATFFRDDYRRRELVTPSTTNIKFEIENKKVLLVDDVISTGRMIRAAMDAMVQLGRPDSVELCVLIDRIYNRDLPIAPKYVGMAVNTLDTQKVLVELTEQGFEKDQIWLID